MGGRGKGRNKGGGKNKGRNKGGGWGAGVRRAHSRPAAFRLRLSPHGQGTRSTSGYASMPDRAPGSLSARLVDKKICILLETLTGCVA